MLNLFQVLTTATNALTDFAGTTGGVDWVYIFTLIKTFLLAVNDWLYGHLGIYLFQLLKLIGQFFVWILQFIIESVRYGMSFL